MNEHNELWVDIEGMDGLYQVSNRGRIRRTGKTILIRRQFTPANLKVVLRKNGARQVTLSKDGVTKTYSVDALLEKYFPAIEGGE